MGRFGHGADDAAKLVAMLLDVINRRHQHALVNQPVDRAFMIWNLRLRAGKKQDTAVLDGAAGPGFPTGDHVNLAPFERLDLFAGQQVHELDVRQVNSVILGHVLKRNINRRAFRHADFFAEQIVGRTNLRITPNHDLLRAGHVG